MNDKPVDNAWLNKVEKIAKGEDETFKHAYPYAFASPGDTLKLIEEVRRLRKLVGDEA